MKKKDTEIRVFEAELDQDTGSIGGYAAVWNQYSLDLGGFTEIITPGAFKDTIQNDDIRALLNHDSNFVLGRKSAGTLAMMEDDHGLKVQIKLPATTWAQDLRESMQRGDIDQMSFQFRPVDDNWKTDPDRGPVHELHKASLLDVSVVTFPAYPQTSATARSMVESLTTEDSDQDGQQGQPTRQAGYSRHIEILDKLE